MTNNNKWIDHAKADYLPDIGQLSRADIRDLNKAVKAGILIRYRGYWNSGCPIAGIGPLKTIWRSAN